MGPALQVTPFLAVQAVGTASSGGGGPPPPPQPLVSYYGFDGQGSVRLLTDSTTVATVTDTYDYDAYGVLLQTSTSGFIVNNYRYTGQQWDPDLGMYCLRARYYRQGTGRFWTLDAYEGREEEPLSLHKYLYAASDPINRTDPSGHEFTLIGLSIASGIATAIHAMYDAAVVGTGMQVLEMAQDAEEMIASLAVDAELSGAAMIPMPMALS